MTISTIKELSSALKHLDTGVKRNGNLTSIIGESIVNEVRDNLADIPYSDLEAGGGNESGYVRESHTQSKSTITWSGPNIWYLEFGTGSPAVGAYPDAQTMAEANGYEPQATGHSLGQYWVLPDEFTDSAGKYIVTKGWYPYAPFYHARESFIAGKYQKELESAVHSTVNGLLE